MAHVYHRNETICTNTCGTSRNGSCEDSGPNSASNFCDLGTDCDDCGITSADYYVTQRITDLGQLREYNCRAIDGKQCIAMRDVEGIRGSSSGVRSVTYSPVVYDELPSNDKREIEMTLGWPASWILMDHSHSPWGYNRWLDEDQMGDLKYRISDMPDKCIFAGSLKQGWGGIMSNKNHKTFNKLDDECRMARQTLSDSGKLDIRSSYTNSSSEEYAAGRPLYCVYDKENKSIGLKPMGDKEDQLICDIVCDDDCKVFNDVHRYCNDEKWVPESPTKVDSIRPNDDLKTKLCDIHGFPKKCVECGSGTMCGFDVVGTADNQAHQRAHARILSKQCPKVERERTRTTTPWNCAGAFMDPSKRNGQSLGSRSNFPYGSKEYCIKTCSEDPNCVAVTHPKSSTSVGPCYVFSLAPTKSGSFTGCRPTSSVMETSFFK